MWSLSPGSSSGCQRSALLLKQRLAELADLHSDIIEEVRGEGLLLGMKCRVPATELFSALLQQRMLTVGAGENVLRLLPPLIIGEGEIMEAAQKISAACVQLNATNHQ